MSNDDIKWAKSHGWYVGTDGNGTVFVKDWVWNDITHDFDELIKPFTDLSKLMEWARY